MDVTANKDHQQTMGLIAGLISAFAVFLLGGGTVLITWVSAQRTAPIERMQQDAVGEIAPVTQKPIGLTNTPETKARTSPKRKNPDAAATAPAKSVNRTVRPRRTSGSQKSNAPARRSRTTDAKPAVLPASGESNAAPPSEPVYVLDLPPEAGVQRTGQNPSSSASSRPDSPTAPSPSARLPASSSTPTNTVNATGRGTVIILGDANRVRLIGNRGTFGAGALPAGAYTIQATFDGAEPSMAGRVEIGDGERVRVVCIAGRQTCTRM